MKRYGNYILYGIVFFACFGFDARAQNIMVQARLDKNSIRIGDQTTLHLSVRLPSAQPIVFPQLSDTLTARIQVLGSSKPDTVIDQKDRNYKTISQSFTITSFDAGSYVIPPFEFHTQKGVLSTNDLVLQVQSVKVDTTKAIYDIKQPLAVSYTWIDWLRDHWPWLALALLVSILALSAIYYLKKRRKVEPPEKEVKITLPEHQLALNQLQELADKKLWQTGQVKLYYSELSDILRAYLEKRYPVKTQEKTTDEIFTSLKRLEITEENRHILRQLLILADLVKFAKEKPLPSENELSMANAINFVLSTQRMVQEPSGQKEGGSADGTV